MNVSDEELGAFVDGELEPAARAAIAAAIGQDPQLAARVAALESLNRQLKGAFGGALTEPVPARLLAAASGSSAPPVADLGAARDARAAKRRGAPSPRGWMALAASVLVGLLVGRFVMPAKSPELITVGANGLTAGPALARSLDGQLAQDAPSAEGVAVGLSYRSKGGAYCRTFSVNARGGLAGLACHDSDHWHIGALGESAGGGAATGGYRQAATDLAPAVRAAVADSIDGEPFDAGQEALARQHGWR